jgi:hypothetical protein
VAVSALRDLQQQLAVSEQQAARLRTQVEDAQAETKAVRREAEDDASQRDLESSQLRHLIIELKDELQQAVRVRSLNKRPRTLPAFSITVPASRHGRK